MKDYIYSCGHNDNQCAKKEQCARYKEATEESITANLYRQACTEENEYILFIKKDGE